MQKSKGQTQYSRKQKELAKLAIPYDKITAEDLEVIRDEKKNTKRS
jgi:hypothetical protein